MNEQDTSAIQGPSNEGAPKSTPAEILLKLGGVVIPQMNNLPFKRLREHLNADFYKSFEGRKYHITRNGAPKARLCMDGEMRVFAIPIVEKFHEDGKGGVSKFELVELLLWRCTEYVHWDILRDESSLVFDTIPTALYSKNSEIIYSSNHPELHENLAKIDLPDDFEARVQDAIMCWVKGAVKKREAVLKDLRKLQKKFTLTKAAPVAK